MGRSVKKNDYTVAGKCSGAISSQNIFSTVPVARWSIATHPFATELPGTRRQFYTNTGCA